jgi:hypothetical protein
VRRAIWLAPLLVLLAACGTAGERRASLPRLPAGVAGGRVVYAAMAGEGRTRVVAVDRRTGRVLRSTSLRGAWAIPAVVGEDRSGSLSGDGRTLALAAPRGSGTSRFALLDTRFASRPLTFTLPGRFDFDALAPDAHAVYLIQHAGAGRYRVRAWDAALRSLLPGAIVEKGEPPDEPMSGAPVARAIAAGGSPVYTLYRDGADGPFVHALDTDEGIATCVDLPRGEGWRLAWARDGSGLYAVNSALHARVHIT